MINLPLEVILILAPWAEIVVEPLLVVIEVAGISWFSSKEAKRLLVGCGRLEVLLCKDPSPECREGSQLVASLEERLWLLGGGHKSFYKINLIISSYS